MSQQQNSGMQLGCSDASEKIACHGTGDSCAEDIDALCSIVLGAMLVLGTFMCVCNGVTETRSFRDNSG